MRFRVLLTVAFSNRFQSITDVQRTVYYVTFLLAGLSLVLLLAPSSFHRRRFRQHDKETMMRWANVEVLAALVLTSFSIAGTVFLITDLLFTTGFALVASVGLWLAASAFWWAGPLLRRRRTGSYAQTPIRLTVGSRASTSISILMRGSDNPHTCIVAAGGASPKEARRIGQHGSKSSRSGNRYRTRTTSANPHPAWASAVSMLRRHCAACSTTSSAIVIVV